MSQSGPSEIASNSGHPSTSKDPGYALLTATTRKILEEKDLSRVLRTICEEACHVLGADRSQIIRIRDGETSLQREILYAHKMPQEYLDRVQISSKKSLLHEVIQKKQLEVFSDLENESSIFDSEAVRRMGLRVLCAIPIIVEKKSFGALALYHLTPKEYTPKDRQLAEAFGDLASIAIEKAQLTQKDKERATHLEIVDKIARAVNATLKPEELFHIIAQEIHRAVPCYRCIIASLDRAKMTIHTWHRESNMQSDSSRLNNNREFIDWIYKHVYETKQPSNIHDLTKLNLPLYSSRVASGLRSYLYVPIIQNDVCIAHLSLSSRDVGAFSTEDEELLTSVANHLGSAIRNATLFRAAEERSSRLVILNDLNQKITENLDIDAVLKIIAEATLELLGGDLSKIFLLNESTREIIPKVISTKKMTHEDLSSIKYKFGEGAMGKIVERGEAMIIPDVLEYPGWKKNRKAMEMGLRSYIGYPLRVRDRIIGAINCQAQEVNFFHEDDLNLIASLASQAAITIENARLHEEAQHSRNFFQSVVDDNADAIMVTNQERNILHWNASAEKLYGYTEADMLGESITIIIPEDDQGDDREKLIYTSGKSLFFEAERLRKDGSRVPVSITISPVKNDEGAIIAASIIHKDLTDRKRSEETIRQSEEKYRNLIEFAADAIFVHDLNAKFLDVNQRACENLGYTRDELLTMSISDIAPSFNPERFSEQWRNMEKDDQIIFESIHRRKNGTIYPIEICAGKIDSNGQQLIIALGRDITNRKRNEEELRFARDEAEAASYAKSEFLSTMSHELRSPLNAVIGFSDLLMRDAEENSELTNHLVPKIRDSGKYLLSMIEEMLDLDRIKEGKVRLKLEPVSLNDLIFRVVDSWYPRLPEGFSLGMQLDHATGSIGCDSTRITQIMNNLIDNAVKYSPGGGAILVQTVASAEDVQISVRDEGMGINTEEKKIVFDRFAQLERGYTRRAGGLGIGLALAREIMEMHGGRILVESEEGVGSTFTITLPRIQVTNRGNNIQSGGVEETAGHDDPWAGRSILIVDDMENYHEYLQLLMKNAARLESAFNGKEAIEATKQERPDIILMDLRMPVMDGFDAIECLKSDPRTKDIPVLAVTAQAMTEDRERAMRVGADGFVTKPIIMAELTNEMRRLLWARV